MIKLYSFLFRKAVRNIVVGSYYINDQGQLIKIIRLDSTMYSDNVGDYWGIDGNKPIATKLNYDAGWDIGEFTSGHLYELNDRDKKKYWPQIVKGEEQ